MKKLTRKQYIQLIANAMNETYGNTLAEYNTDIDMAKAVLKKLKKYLYFRHENVDSKREFELWKKGRLGEE